MHKRLPSLLVLLLGAAVLLAAVGYAPTRPTQAEGSGGGIYAPAVRSFNFVSSVHDSAFTSIRRTGGDASGNIYVGDEYLDAVRMYNINGTFVRQFNLGHINANPLGSTVYNGELYVADWGMNRIVVFNQATGDYVRSFGSYGTGFGQFSGPQAVAFAPDGWLYVVESGNRRVQVLTSTGSAIGTLTAGWTFPTSLAFDSKGDFYVADVNGNTVKKIHKTGAFSFTLVRTTTVTTPLTVSIDRSNNIYVGQRDTYGFQVYNWQGELMAEYHAQGTEHGAFGQGAETVVTVTAVAITNSGPVIWASDVGNDRLQRFAWTTIPVSHSYQAKWGGLPAGSGNGQLNNPLAITVDSQQNIYVSDRGNNRVQKFDRYGTFLGAWGSLGNGPGQFSGLYGIGYNAYNGLIYTVETGNNRVQYFTTNGIYQGEWGSYGTGNKQFDTPANIAFDDRGYVYIADELNHRIQKFTATGDYVRQWGSYGIGNGQFQNPSGIAIDNTRHLVYVSDFFGERLQIFSEFGDFVKVVAASLSGTCDLDDPISIAADQHGSIYVTDRGASHVTQFDTNGACIGTFGANGPADGQLAGLMGITYNGRSGQIYTTEWATGNNRVQRFGSPIPKNNRVGIWRPSMRTFYLRLNNTTGPADITVDLSAWALPTDKPVAGDWNGDGIDTVGLFRNGRFLLRDSNTSGAPDYDFMLGSPGDLPMVGDWDGDGKDGVGVFRPSNGILYMKNTLSTGFADFAGVLGMMGDIGVAGDWNADGQDSPGVFRPSQARFFLTNKVSNGIVYADFSFWLGNPGDAPFMGDWVHQGWSGAGVFRPTNGITYMKNDLTTGFADVSMVYGIAGDAPVAGEWGPNPNLLTPESAELLTVEQADVEDGAPEFKTK